MWDNFKMIHEGTIGIKKAMMNTLIHEFELPRKKSKGSSQR